jgi:hypothetical protein
MTLILIILLAGASDNVEMHNYRAPLLNKVDSRCYENDYVRAWVYFTDKGIHIADYDKAINIVRKNMGKASLLRRALRDGTIDYADIPTYDEYINEVELHGGVLCKKSKWLNAASFWIAKADLDRIANLPFIHKITKVADFKGPSDIETVVQDTAVFGITYQQFKMFNIDSLHSRGIFGSGVKIGILDSGLRRKHTALANIRVIAEHDFLEGDRIFKENIPITDEYGVYGDIVFLKTDSRLNLFITGDTLAFGIYPVRDLMYTYSTDGGMNWQPLERVTQNYNNWSRELAVCGDDTMFVFYQDRYGIRYVVYYDSVLYNRELISGPFYKEPSSIQIVDTIYVGFHDKNYLYLMKDGVVGFSPNPDSIIIIDSSITNIKSPKIVSGDAKIGIFYNLFPEDSLFFTKSSLPETTFTKKFVGLGKGVDAVSNGDTIFAIWKDVSSAPLFNITFAKSTDFGNTFTNTQLSDDLNSAGKISITRLNTAITVMWESSGKIYFKISNDNGNTFGNIDSLNTEFVYLPTLGTTGSEIIKFYCTRGDSTTDGYSTNDPRYYYPHHGTKMLGLIGGYFINHYIGVAPSAEFLVAKTENPDSLYEFPIEEDTWVAGLEWMESKGADIVNSSLGYSVGYSWPDDFDGRTSPASIAAHEATRRGVIIVNAVGNYSLPRISIPGDAEDVITVGGIDSLFGRWQSSGYFPTSDHSLKKPEIMCLSAAPVVVDPDSTDSYWFSFGTSGATAMITGICALLLEGHPNWSIDSVRSALFQTASYADTPSDSMGYGWVDAWAAFNTSPPYVDDFGPGNVFLTPYPNPFIVDLHNEIYIPFKLTSSYRVDIRLYSMSGKLIKEDQRPLLLPGKYDNRDPLSSNAAFTWDGKDEDGKDVGSGIYYCVLITYGGGRDITKIAVVR